MKALVKTASGKGNIELQERPCPTPGKDDVLIKVNRAGVCGTDVHIEHDRFANSPPVTLGHEFSGTIEQIGVNVTGLSKGDRVVSSNNPFACGQCDLCRAGNPNLCLDKRAMGIHSDGCFADYVKLESTLIHKIPDNVTFEQAALTEPLAVAVQAVAHNCGIEDGDTVVVFGAGAIGLLAAQVARAEGAGQVIVVGTSRDEKVRFPCARGLGLHTINVGKGGLVDEILKLTKNRGTDVVVEASGNAAAIQQGSRLLKRTGRMAISGITGKPDVAVDWDHLVSKGVTLHFCYGSVNADWEKGLQYLSEGKVLTQPLITHQFNLEQWHEAFRSLESLDAIRPVFEIEGT